MVTCTSMGANAAALFGFALACLFAGKVIYAVFIMFCSLFLYANSDMIDDFILALNPGKTMEMIETGNGRDAIWEALLNNAQQKPLLGWGYACIERTAPDVLGGQILSDAHNNYIGMYGSLGVVGLVLFVYHLVVSALSAFGHRMKVGYLGLFVAMHLQHKCFGLLITEKENRLQHLYYKFHCGKVVVVDYHLISARLLQVVLLSLSDMRLFLWHIRMFFVFYILFKGAKLAIIL